MGTNYVESSLKRFLKRKVKVTLGLVVAFLITGTVGFAEETEIQKLEKQNQNFKDTKEYLSGLGAEISTNNNTAYDITGENEGNAGGTGQISVNRKDGVTTITAKFVNKDGNITKEIKNISFNDKFVSTKVQTAVNNALNGKTYTAISAGATDEQKMIAENNGILLVNSGSSYIKTGIKSDGTKINKLTNNGIMFNGQHTAINNSEAYNYGMIYLSDSSVMGQIAKNNDSTAEIKDTKLYNYGLISSMKAGQSVSKGNNTSAYNYGVITSDQYGQFAEQSSVKTNFYNYGIIDAKQTGQQLQLDNSTAENYGTINISESESVDVRFSYGQYSGDTATNRAYNYGLIKVINGTAMGGMGTEYNYGVIKASGNSDIFKYATGTVSKGIIIGGNTEKLENYKETTAIFDKDYNLQNKDNAVEISKKLDGNNFGDKKLAVIENDSASLSGIFNDKTIASVVHGNQDETNVFTLEDGETVLKNTSLVGYFENQAGGTLLTVEEDKILTLDGITQITAVKDLQSDTGDVYALNLLQNSTLNLVGNNVKINGIIKGDTTTNVKAYALAGSMKVDGGNITLATLQDDDINSEYIKANNYIDNAKLEGNMDSLTFNFNNTAENKINTITIVDGTIINAGGSFTDLTETGNKSEITIENIDKFAENLNELKFGTGENTVILHNTETFGKAINLGTGGEDKLVVNYSTKVEDKVENGVEYKYNKFDYNVKNAETIELSGAGEWTIGTNAAISFDNDNKAHEVKLNAANGANLNIIMQEGGSNLNKLIKDGLLESGDSLVLGTDEDSRIKYQIGGTGLPFTGENTSYTADYGIAEDANVVAPIFNVSSDGKTTSISLKTAEQAGLGNYSAIYNAYIKQVADANWDVIEYINSLNSDKDFADRIVKTDLNAKAYYTAGTVVTKNITDSYLSAVEEFGKRAQKGEWIAQGKFINSDTEFDGGSKVKGYDGDINSAVAMVEYGVTENTSYGVAFGGGDTEIDIDGGGKLDGDNYYLGAYVKHRTQNGIYLVGNFGIMKSDLDSKLGNEFGFTVNGVDMSGTTFEEGTADSTAFALSLKGTKDFYVADTVKLQPVLGARMTLINQDKAENPAMNFEIKEQDVFVAEGILGVNAVKEFALEKGIFELNTGVEYSLAASTENDDAEYRLFNNDDIKIENGEIASSKGTFHLGADYEHENGVGFNAKYEMMWSDEGDDSRITAGISYRF